MAQNCIDDQNIHLWQPSEDPVDGYCGQSTKTRVLKFEVIFLMHNICDEVNDVIQ